MTSREALRRAYRWLLALEEPKMDEIAEWADGVRPYLGKPVFAMSREALVEHVGRMMRDRAYPEFVHAPLPLWAMDAAETVVAFFEDSAKRELFVELPGGSPGHRPSRR